MLTTLVHGARDLAAGLVDNAVALAKSVVDFGLGVVDKVL